MANEFFVTLQDLINDMKLKTIYMPKPAEEIKITSIDVNRPGLQIAGFFDYFDNTRVQVMGKVEFTFLERFTPEKRRKSIERFMSTQFAALIIARDLEPYDEMITYAKEFCIPILSSSEATSAFMSALIAYLNLNLAERITRHGVLVEAYGEGILILGESGVGKSETAMELVKRGHRLIADDAVEIKKVSNRTLVGSAPEMIRHFIELRGIGIVDVKRIFGMGAVKDSEKIDMIIQLEAWEENKMYDRLGMENTYMNILGIDIPSLTIPVKPGRNLAIILEVAAMNNRQKKMGYNAAKELNNRLMADMERKMKEGNM